MQYLLSEEEYVALKNSARVAQESVKIDLQILCTMLADNMPIVRSWAPDRPASPWGCILSKTGKGCGYCDECPAKKLCPCEHKEWSK